MVSVSVAVQEPVIEYVITWFPTPATAGSKAPVAPLVIPVPDQVPPGSAAVKITDGAFTQNGPAGVIVASQVVGEHGGSVEIPLIVITLPKLSVTLRVSTPGGGVIVEPVVKVVQKPGALHEVTGIGKGLKQFPKVQVPPQLVH